MVKQKGSSLSLPAYGREGQGQHSLAAHFAKRNTKNCGGEKSEGGAGIPFPPTPFPSRPARAEKFSALPRKARQSKFRVRIFVKKCSDFVQKVPPIFKIRILGDCCLALATLGLGFGKDFEGKFEIQKQFLPAQTEVRFAEGKHKFEKFINQSFFFRLWRKAKR